MVAEVIVDVLNSEVDKIFDYLMYDDSNIKVGDRVLLPFGKRTIEGYVINIKQSSTLSLDKLKYIIKKLDENPIILPELLELAKQLKVKNHLRMVDVIRLIIPSPIRKNIKAKQQITLSLNGEIATEYKNNLRANAKKMVGAIEYFASHNSENKTILIKLFGASCINKLICDKVLKLQIEEINRFKITKGTNKVVNLTPDQCNAVNTILSNPQGYLLHGVTGSGKTEVYMHVIDEVLRTGKTAIMLVPEISLTPQMVRVFSGRFGDNLAVIHSALMDGERRDEWNRIYSKKAKIVIGARSAIFAPIQNVGVIIVDEEHDSSYFSESNPRFDTHDVALFRAKYNNCPCVFGSATPSVNSYYLAQSNKLKLIEMPIRVNNKDMPKIQLVDMSQELKDGNTTPFSKELLGRLNQTIEDKKQAILFINRRGFSSFLMCRDCGHIPKCEDCDVSLTYHKFDNALKCHYCGKRYKALTMCPVCGSKNIKLGGVGTENVTEQLQKLFPNVKIFRMDNDTTQTKNAHATILSEFSNSHPGILVGTQMVAKGHDFPEVNLVGLLDADLSLFFGDYQANEKTFELVTQVSGRAGRDKIEGNVILQTYFPNNFVYKMCAEYNYKKFYDKEINLRHTTLFPPYSVVVRVLVSGVNEDILREVTHSIFLGLKNVRLDNKNDFYFLEAMKSPITKIKGKHRFQILMRFNSQLEDKIMPQIYAEIDKVKTKNISIFVEKNPSNLN